MSQWVINVNDGQEVLTIDDGLYDVTVSDTFNPFGNYAKGFFDDLEGELFDLLRRGAKVSFQYDADYTEGFTQRFVGFTVAELLNDSDGAEQLEVEAYTFDQFLRGGEVSNDQTGKTLFEALEDVITNDVPPVQWNASLVEVVDNVELTQGFEGDRVEDFLLEVRQKSTGELFGVTEDLEFFFEPAERTRTRRDIDNSQWFDHDIREESGETKNQVKVSYNDGNDTLLVDDTSDQLKLQDNLGAVGPGQDAASINRPEITDFEDAIDAGEQFLERREATLTGPVSTFELNDATPGQVISIEIEPRGIDTDFRIAENLIRWQSESNELTVVAKKGADDDILIEQSKTLQRVDKRPRDESVIPDRVTDTKPTAELPILVDADGVTSDVSRVVNDGRNRIRDGIIDESEIQGFEVVFSTTDSRPSRSDSTISDIVGTDTPTVSTNPQSVTYTASTTESDIQTIGVRDTDRDILIAVGRLQNRIDSPSVDFTINVENAGDEKSLFTEAGLNFIRDILAGVTPSWPQEYAYGSDATDPAETDTALGTEVVSQSLDEILIKRVDSNSEWGDNINRTLPDRLVIENSRVKLAQSGYFREAEDADNQASSTEITNSDFSGQQGLETGENPNADTLISFEFTAEHAIDAEEIAGSVRYEVLTDNENPEFTFFYRVNGNRFDFGAVPEDSLNAGIGWFTELTSDQSGSEDFQDIERGDVVEFGIEAFTTTSGSGEIEIDCLHMGDSRFDYTYDNTLGEFDELDGPELYPASFEFDISPAKLRRDATEARVVLEIDDNDTSNAQRIGVSVDGTTYQYADNTLSASFALSEPSKEIYTQLRIDGYTPATRTSSPATRYESQRVDLLDLFANPDAITKDDIGEANVRAIILAGDAVNSTFAESGLFDSAGNLLTSAVVPEFQKDEHLVISSERLRFDND